MIFLPRNARLSRYQMGETWPLFMCSCGWVYDYGDRWASTIFHSLQSQAWTKKILPVLMSGGLASDAEDHQEIAILASAAYHLQQDHSCDLCA